MVLFLRSGTNVESCNQGFFLQKTQETVVFSQKPSDITMVEE